jgi:hypothetical protein
MCCDMRTGVEEDRSQVLGICKMKKMMMELCVKVLYQYNSNPIGSLEKQTMVNGTYKGWTEV